MYSKNGSNFTIDQTLITFLDYLVRNGIIDANILDKDNSPVHIEDVPLFLKDITRIYFEVTNDYLAEYRNVKSIIDIKDI